MYERFYNKNEKPTLEKILETIGECKAVLFNELLSFLNDFYDLSTDIKYPFGNKYGWGIKCSHKTKHLCYIFPEKHSFTITIQIGTNEVEKLQNVFATFLPKTQELWQNRYPCGSGGWLHYRVFTHNELQDVKKLITIKKNPPKK
ncbi:DUF3788 domain-containing protein [Clostridium sp. 'deep sea']|uniref:DUF3788 domain-containing protein n=1 Tax=Clostridium sp. 'deep sea' TaxID=2779445 RepID=UPI001896939E|nr:DUF3788 domain-containing protein [Clostridium sp. 'deep sea']QOR36042.1 DUF3788 domain-containing protein [Clostridium sp. 'deep sea']